MQKGIGGQNSLVATTNMSDMTRRCEIANGSWMKMNERKGWVSN